MCEWYKPVVFWSDANRRWHSRNSRGWIIYFDEWERAIRFALGKDPDNGSKSGKGKQDEEADAEPTSL